MYDSSSLCFGGCWHGRQPGSRRRGSQLLYDVTVPQKAGVSQSMIDAGTTTLAKYPETASGQRAFTL